MQKISPHLPIFNTECEIMSQKERAYSIHGIFLHKGSTSVRQQLVRWLRQNLRPEIITYGRRPKNRGE